MTTPTPRLGLLKPSTADQFSTADIAANWQAIDDNPGTFICTSSTRPPWTDAHKGREILEVDTGLKWTWAGVTTGFVRQAPTGLLRTTGGGYARSQRITSLSVPHASGTVVGVSVNNVIVPPGFRTLMLVATWPLVVNDTTGKSALYIYRSNVAGQAPLLAGWYVSGYSTSPPPGTAGSGGSFITYEQDGLAPGTYNYSIQVASSYAGTTTVSSDATTPLELSVIEI